MPNPMALFQYFRGFAFLLLLLSLTACSKHRGQIGTIDESLMITAEEIWAMGFDEFKKEYLGKEITITNLPNALGVSGFYNESKEQCKFSYSNDPSEFPIDIDIYANHFPDSALEQIFSEGSYTNESLQYEDEIALPAPLCKRCYWEEDPDNCYVRSPNATITGKVIKLGRPDEYIKAISISMKIKGIAY